MLIERIDVHRVNVPVHAPYHWAHGLNFGMSKAIVEVHTDDGVTGLGELASIDAAHVVEDEIAPRLVGMDPTHIDACFACAVPDVRTAGNTDESARIGAFGGVEIALWDVKARALDVPVYMLLGGPIRSEVEFSEYFALRPGSEETSLDVARYCARMRDLHGSVVFEGKVGSSSLSSDIDLISEVRAAAGDDALLRIDANAAWPLRVAREAVVALAQYDIANIEEPTADPWDLVKLRTSTTIPFSSHSADHRLTAALGVPDSLVLNLTRLGGIKATVKFIAVCEALSIGFWFFSGDTGIGSAAYLHVAAATPYLTQPHQSLMRWYADDVIVGGPFAPQNGRVTVPTGAGLGVELDPEALKRCKAHFDRVGPLTQFGAPGERWYRRPPLQ